MAKCNKCNNTKNNKSGYCKVHYYNRSKSANETYKVNDGNRQSSTQLNSSGSHHSDIISDLISLISDNNLIAFIKDGMLKEKLWYEEMRKLFLNFIEKLNYSTTN